MTASNCLSILAISLGALAWGTHVCAEADVTIIAPAKTASQKASSSGKAPDGTPIVHKASHKKKSLSAETASAPAVIALPAPDTKPAVNTAPPVASGALAAAASSSPIKPVSTFPPTAKIVPNPPPSTVLTVETALPIPRHNTPAPPNGTLLASTYSPLSQVANPYPLGAYTHSPMASDFVFANFARKSRISYPWKTNIITTMFWIGEGSTPISATDNMASAWDQEWRSTNHGSDSPYDRSGYASGSHASTVNPFYVALPFNDLAFPEKAQEYLPRGWHRPMKDGKQVSACKDRWVEIRNQEGDHCFAQWEDVGPLRIDHAEYVFGNERPIGLGDDHAGLDVSPAVAQYLGIDEKHRYTSWRFVEDEDVLPGAWLKYDEQAVLYQALHNLKNNESPSTDSIQNSAVPSDDSDGDKKRAGAAKG